MSGRKFLTYFAPGDKVSSDETGNSYVVESALNFGGFGGVFRVRSTRRGGDLVALKITEDQAGWHREWFYSRLMHEDDRVVPVVDSFPIKSPRARRPDFLYCLCTPFYSAGTVGDRIRAEGPMDPAWVEEEVRRLLMTMADLHDQQMIHRDITPNNVFVDDGGALLLGDFGIATWTWGTPFGSASMLNEAFAPTRVLDDLDEPWRKGDDVYQLARLAIAMVSGSTEHSRARATDIKRLPVSDAMREFLYFALTRRTYQTEDAGEAIRTLDSPAVRFSRKPSSLRGEVVVVTGAVEGGQLRLEAALSKAGALVRDKVDQDTRVLVVGARNANFLTSGQGTKLLAARRLRRRGQTISLMTAAEVGQFV